MARMVLDRPVGLPVGPLAGALRRHLPEYRWQVGDGPQDGLLPLDRPAGIIGRSGDAMVMLGLDLVEGTLDAGDAPPHAFHVRLTGPTTDERALAERLLFLVGDALTAQGGGALQVEEGGHWFSADELRDRSESLGGPPPALSEDPAPPPPVTLDPPSPSFPRGTGTDRPSFGRRGT